MGRKVEQRIFEKGQFKAEILGSTKNCQLWINNKFVDYFESLTEARLFFMSYARRHSA